MPNYDNLDQEMEIPDFNETRREKLAEQVTLKESKDKKDIWLEVTKQYELTIQKANGKQIM